MSEIDGSWDDAMGHALCSRRYTEDWIAKSQRKCRVRDSPLHRATHAGGEWVAKPLTMFTSKDLRLASDPQQATLDGNRVECSTR